MRSTGVLVHSSLVHITTLDAFLYVLEQLFLCFDVNLCQAVHEYAGLWILSDLQVLSNLLL